MAKAISDGWNELEADYDDHMHTQSEPKISIKIFNLKSKQIFLHAKNWRILIQMVDCVCDWFCGKHKKKKQTAGDLKINVMLKSPILKM